MQPADLRPSDITARLGAPWIPADDVVAFVKETMGADIRIHHMPELASWTVEAAPARLDAPPARRNGAPTAGMRASFSPMRSTRRVPQIFDTIRDGDSERRVLNVVDTEAAKEKLSKIKDRIPELDLDRSRPHRSRWRASITTASTISCREPSTARI